MAREVKILVKNVYATSESQQFVVPETMLVRALKQRIHATLPGAPAVAHQKLIFGGQVCQDTDALEHILSRNQVQSEERVDDDTAAVVFHLVLPRTPTAASAKAEAEKAARPRSASPRISVDAANAVATQAALTGRVNVAQSADRANIDSPRPAPIATAAASAPAFDLDASLASVAAPAQSSAFPVFGQFQGQAAATERNPQQVHQDLYTQGMLMHQQAMILAQIQYLQHVKAHYESISAQSGQTRAAQAQSQMPFHAPFAAPYAHFGMGMHPQMYGMHHAAGVAHPMAPAPATVAPAAPAATARRNPLIVQIAREILPLFDMRLAMKMAFMLFIIGQDTPNDRVLVLALLSFISYLHICGIFAKIYEVYKRQYAVATPVDAPAGQANGADDANPHDNNGVAAPGAPGGAVTRFDFTRVLRISSDRGLVHDVKYFLVGLVLSLVPAWHPQPTDGGNAMPPMQDLPDAAGEIPVQGI
uniref:Ubiquitin-like domain-containing protein n=1 Tax=Globisporangium ultimum (strain ATCC 200006 / CBS 805.95 / DAOM BR144) TaxID=431595 RepID=K3WNG0_GLOUD